MHSGACTILLTLKMESGSESWVIRHCDAVGKESYLLLVVVDRISLFPSGLAGGSGE